MEALASMVSHWGKCSVGLGRRRPVEDKYLIVSKLNICLWVKFPIDKCLNH